MFSDSEHEQHGTVTTEKGEVNEMSPLSPNVMPGDCFQAAVQGEGSQAGPAHLPELGTLGGSLELPTHIHQSGTRATEFEGEKKTGLGCEIY